MYLTLGDEQLSPLPMSKYNKFNDTVFIPRAFDWIDPLKEMNANVFSEILLIFRVYSSAKYVNLVDLEKS